MQARGAGDRGVPSVAQELDCQRHRLGEVLPQPQQQVGRDVEDVLGWGGFVVVVGIWEAHERADKGADDVVGGGEAECRGWILE